ncbi:hypothetical protein EV198_3422 [Roseivirga ehrenbergii]|uniref:Uncharacterized protein n=1 Tax=Roseivirga ehrenbergii (strain DSM 102268 / JCM 13514 / KCTC 12282 / NCIMB 14502 / KMM 6017) TaxID=279360 RepID=A0A150WY04_ROSEK|nr:hypothetical protein MB14_11340 [Roseivirga ehrenbergii]TCK99592.1 hypothetical protein EV198_3422 [Roseivirga ehrenbergii]
MAVEKMNSWLYYQKDTEIDFRKNIEISDPFLLALRTFVLTVLATLPIRTASQGESFAFIAPLFCL